MLATLRLDTAALEVVMLLAVMLELMITLQFVTVLLPATIPNPLFVILLGVIAVI